MAGKRKSTLVAVVTTVFSAVGAVSIFGDADQAIAVLVKAHQTPWVVAAIELLTFAGLFVLTLGGVRLFLVLRADIHANAKESERGRGKLHARIDALITKRDDWERENERWRGKVEACFGSLGVGQVFHTQTGGNDHEDEEDRPHGGRGGGHGGGHGDV